VTYIKDGDGYVQGGDATTNQSDTYILVSTDKYALVSYAYPKWAGTTYDLVDADRLVFAEHTGTGKGLYMSLGDFRLAAKVDGLYVRLNKDFSENLMDKMDADDDGTLNEYVRIQDLKATLSMSINVSLYGSGKADNNTIDLSELIQLFMPGDEMSSAKLMLNIVNEVGSQSGAYLKLDLVATVDLSGTEPKLNLMLELVKYVSSSNTTKTLLGVYLFEDVVYVDLSGILGSAAKIKLEGVNLGGLLKDTLGGVFGSLGIDGMFGGTAGEASTAAAEEIGTLNGLRKNWPYLMLMFNPRRLLLQLNADLINVVYRKILSLRGAEQKNFIPDLGDLLLNIGTDSDDHTTISLNLRLSDALYMTLDLPFPQVDKDVDTSTISSHLGNKNDFIKVGTLDLEALLSGDPDADIMSMLDLPTIGINLDMAIQISSRGYEPGTTNYNNSFANWLSSELLGGLLDGVGALGTWTAITTLTGTNGLQTYTGKIYTFDSTTNTYVATTEDMSNKTSADLRDSNNKYKYYRFVSNSINLRLGTATDSIRLSVSLKANLNLGALILYGIGGILYSDMSIQVGIGDPLNTQMLNIYYLGSTGLARNSMGKIEVTKGANIFSDALYIDATGIGLGKIKFQGAAGILGVTSTSAEAVTATESATVSAEAVTAAEAATELFLNVDIENGRLGISFDKGLITTLFNMLGVELGFELPDIKHAAASINFGEQQGLDAINITADLDSVGTSIGINISNIGLSVGEGFFDTSELVEEVKVGYAGLTFSQTAGISSLIQNVLDSINLNANIEIYNHVWEALIGSGNQTWQTKANVGRVQVMKSNSKITLSTKKVYENTNTKEEGKETNASYHLRVDLSEKMSSTRLKEDMSLNVVIGGGKVFIRNIKVTMSGLAQNAASLVGALKELLNFFDVGQLLNFVSGTDGDDGKYFYPGTTADKDAQIAANNNELNSTASGWDDPIAKTSYSYTPNLTGLINKVDVDMFNSANYLPYYPGMSALTRNSGLITLGIEFNKDAFNELMIMVDCILLNLMLNMNIHDNDPLRAKDSDASKNNSYFINVASYGINNTNSTEAGEGINYLPLATAKDVLTEFDRRLTMKPGEAGYDASIAFNSDPNTATQKKVNFLEPYIRSLPYTLLKWVLRDVAFNALSTVGSTTTGLLNIWGGAGRDLWDDTFITVFLGSNHYSIESAVCPSVADLSRLVGGILPLPFACGSINPSLKIYIDLAPTNKEYGLSDAYKMNPGIQAVEFYINGRKNGAGTGITYTTKSNTALGYGGTFGTASVGSADLIPTNSGKTDNANGGAWDFFFLRLTPYGNVNSDIKNTMIGFDDAADATVIGSAPPTEIEISDPATRQGVARYNDSRGDKTFYLRDSYFFDESLFPQKADVRYSNGYYTNDETTDGSATGTYIVWDASTVDLTAASIDSSGRRLAGYVYGYALNVVMYTIPVYVTNAYAVRTVQAIKSTADLATATTNSFNYTGAIRLDMNSNNSTFNVELPDLVSLTFQNNSTRTFGTYLTDDEGKMLNAVMLRKGSETYSSTRRYIGSTVISGGYMSHKSYTETDENGVAQTIQPTNADGGTLALYPAYIAGVVTQDKYSVYFQSSYRLSWNEDGYLIYHDDKTDKDYYVIDPYNLPTGSRFPVGGFSWDTNDFNYDWNGGRGENNAIGVDYSYQWGFSATAKGRLNIPSTNYKVSRINVIKTADGTERNLQNVENSDGTWTTTLNIDAMDIDESMENIISYINGFTVANGRMSSNFTGYQVKWDLSELEKALAAVTKDGKVNFYEGVRATVTAYIGGDVFKAFTKTVVKNEGLVNEESSSFGFIGDGSTDTKYASAGHIAQPYQINVVIAPSKYDSIKNPISFDPYTADKLEGNTLFADGDTIRLNVRNFDGSISDKAFTVGKDIQVEAPFIYSSGNWYDAYNNNIFKISPDDINYEGYRYAATHPLYAKLIIGTKFSGQQIAYVPITVKDMEASIVRMTVKHEDTFNPLWFEGSEYSELKVSFNGTEYTMYPDWTQIKYYTNQSCTVERPESQRNIYGGGNISVRVPAYIYELNEDGTPNKNKPIGLVKGKDANGKDTYLAQNITVTLSVERQTIEKVTFFYDETLGKDIYSMTNAERRDLLASGKLTDPNYYKGTVYAQTHIKDGKAFGIDPISYEANPEKYFNAGTLDAFGGTAVLVHLKSGTFTGDRYIYNETDGVYIKDNVNGTHKMVGDGVFEPLTAGDRGDPYIAYVESWQPWNVIEGEGDENTEIARPEFNINGGETRMIAIIGGQKVEVEVRVPSYNFTSSYTEFDFFSNAGLYSKHTEDGTATSDSFGNVEGSIRDGVVFYYNVHKAWILPTSGTFATAEGNANLNTSVFWADSSSPAGEFEVEEDEGGSYVLRYFYFFDGTGLRYPFVDGINAEYFTAKIYLTNTDDTLDRNNPVELEGQNDTYNLFDKFEYAPTATVRYNGFEPDMGVPVSWESKDYPTYSEIKAGRFTRPYVVMTGSGSGLRPLRYEPTFAIVGGFTIDGFEGTASFGDIIYKDGEEFSIESGLRYTLTADKFYGGLPSKSVLRVGGTSMNVTLTWDINYTKNGGQFESVTVTVESENLVRNIQVELIVEEVEISGLTSGMEYNFDPYGKEGDLFVSGSTPTVTYTADGVEYTTNDIVVSYNLNQIGENFYDKVSSFFGRTYALTITYSYSGGNSLITETDEIEVYVIDRTIYYMSDFEYRSLIIDAFLHNDSSYLPEQLDITTLVDYDMSENTFKAYFDWSSLDRLIRNNESNLGFMATARVATKDPNGTYVRVLVDEDGNYTLVDVATEARDSKATFMRAADFESVMRALDSEWTWTAETLAYRVYLASQRFNVPVTVLNREIVSSSLVFNDRMEELYVTNKNSSYTTTFVGIDNSGNRADGRYIDVTTDKSTGLPEEIIFYNKYAYAENGGLAGNILLNFASGDTSTYLLEFENAPTFDDVANTSSSFNRDVKVHIWNGNPSHSDSFEIMDAITIKFTIRTSAFTQYNSDLTYTDMSVDTNSYKYQFSPYASEADSMYNVDNYDKSVKYYVGGTFITAYSWWNDGRTIGDTTIYDSNWERRHAVYTVYGGETNESFVEGDRSFGYYYTYNRNARTYSLYNGVVKYDDSARTYSDENGNSLYVFTYVATQTLNVEWDLSVANYNYKGGNVYVKANVTSPMDGNKCSISVNVIVHVTESMASSYTFGSLNLTADERTFLTADNATFKVDPYGNLNLFERVGGTYHGDLYAKQLDGTFVLSKNGTYKMVSEGVYEELTREELGEYKYLPKTIEVTRADGVRVVLPITWDLSGVTVNYAGGTFTANALINEDGAYDYVRVEGGTKNSVGTQKIQVTFNVVDRTAIATTTNMSLSTRVGYVYVNRNGNITLNTSGASYQYIDPYDWKVPTMPSTVSFFNASSNDGDNNDYKTFYVTEPATKNDKYGGTLVWSYGKYRPSYLGGVVYVTAMLTGADGSTQSFDIPFLVARQLVTRLNSVSGTNNSAYTANSYYTEVDSNGKAATSYMVNPYNPNRLSLPTAYTANLNVFYPTLTRVDGKDVVTFPTSASTTISGKSFNFVTVSMPANATWSGNSSGLDYSMAGKNATIQLGSQQRITVQIDSYPKTNIPNVGSLTVNGTSWTTTGATTMSKVSTLPATTNSRPIVWYGKAYVYAIGSTTTVEAAIPVMFSSTSSTITLPTYGARKVTFRLFAVLGAVVNANGDVITTMTATTAEGTAIGSVRPVIVGQTIPVGQAKSAALTINN
ncbi:MAG: hypothetical protein K2G31_05835, partial [Clostridia bacterium]|nr:hypothetical protein [Clostridia bacterium]